MARQHLHNPVKFGGFFVSEVRNETKSVNFHSDNFIAGKHEAVSYARQQFVICVQAKSCLSLLLLLSKSVSPAMPSGQGGRKESGGHSRGRVSGLRVCVTTISRLPPMPSFSDRVTRPPKCCRNVHSVSWKACGQMFHGLTTPKCFNLFVLPGQSRKICVRDTYIHIDLFFQRGCVEMADLSSGPSSSERSSGEIGPKHPEEPLCLTFIHSCSFSRVPPESIWQTLVQKKKKKGL